MGTRERLKSWRETKGWPQHQCAKRARITQSAWCNIENGRKEPSLVQAAGIEIATDGAIRMVHWLPKRLRPVPRDSDAPDSDAA